MQKSITTFLLLVCLCLISSAAFGQKKKRIKRSNGMRFSFFDSSVDSLDNQVLKSGFAYAGTSFTSNVNALGRDNNINQWSVDPIMGIHKYNTDVYLNSFRWSKTDPKWAETDIGISKLWQISDPISFITTYEHAFIRYGSEDDQLGLNNLFSTQFSYTNKFFDFDARYEYDFGRSAASVVEFSLGHEFDFYDVFVRDKVEITPRFYMTYLGSGTANTGSFSARTGLDALQIANYEIELPFTWRKIGNVEASISLNYAIPKNVLAEEGNGKPIFYMAGSVVKILPFTSKKSKKRAKF